MPALRDPTALRLSELPFQLIRLSEILTRGVVIRSLAALTRTGRPDGPRVEGVPSIGFEQRAQLRADPVLSGIYGSRPLDLLGAIRLADYLRSLSPPGRAPGDFRFVHPLAMLDTMRSGGRFRCGDVSRLFGTLVLAGDTPARVVSLLGRAHRFHVAAEVWSRAHGGWCLIDVDHNYTYWLANGRPASVLDLYRLASSGKLEQVEVRPGGAVFRDPRVTAEGIGKWLCRGFAVQRVPQSPASALLSEHPFLDAVYVGRSRLWRMLFRQRIDPANADGVRHLFADESRSLWGAPRVTGPRGAAVQTGATGSDVHHPRWAHPVVSWYRDRVLSRLYEVHSDDWDFEEDAGAA